MFKIKFKKNKQIYFCLLNILNLLFVSNIVSSTFVIPPPPPPPPSPVLNVPAILTPEQSRVLRQQEIQASKNLTALKTLSKKYVNRLNELLIEATNNLFKKFQFNEELPKEPEFYDATLSGKEEIFIGTLTKDIMSNKSEDASNNKSIIEKQLQDNQAKLASLIPGSDEYKKLEVSVKKLAAQINAKKEAAKLDPFTKLFNFFKNPEYKNNLIKIFKNKAGKFLYKYFKDKDSKILTQPEQEFYDQIINIIKVVEGYEKNITEYSLKKTAAHEQFKLENQGLLDKSLTNIEAKFNFTFFEANKIELSNILVTTSNSIISNKPAWFSNFNTVLDLEEINFIKQFTRLAPKINDPLTVLFNKYKADLNVFNKIFRNKEGVVLYKYFKDKDGNILSEQEILDKIKVEDIKSFYTNIKKVITELQNYLESVSSYLKKLDKDKKEADTKLTERNLAEAEQAKIAKERSQLADQEREREKDSSLKLIDPIETEKLKKELTDLKAENLILVAQKKETDAQKIFEEYKKVVSKLSFSLSSQNCNKKNLEPINSKVKNLVDSGLNINKLFDDNTLTPLMHAINIKVCTEFITFLIKELKADKNLKNNDNLTALDLVKNILSPAKSTSKPRMNPKLIARLNSIKNILTDK
jgi:hypothetical protein